MKGYLKINIAAAAAIILLTIILVSSNYVYGVGSCSGSWCEGYLRCREVGVWPDCDIYCSCSKTLCSAPCSSDSDCLVDDWYCGDGQERQFWDYYCDLSTCTCKYTVKQQVEDCDSFSGWYGGGDNGCGAWDDPASQYRSYRCVTDNNPGAPCTYDVTDTKDCDNYDAWVGGGNTAGCGADPTSYHRDYYTVYGTNTCDHCSAESKNCDASDICQNICDGNVVKQYKDYYVIENANTCTFAWGPIVETCALGCVNGACTKTCTDSDGDNIYVKGNITINNTMAVWDVCSGTSVIEGTCNGTNPVRTTKSCTYGCIDGACAQTTNQTNDTCVDTDGGQNFTVKGTVTKGTQTYTDYCSDSNTLVEKFCQNNNITQITYNCPAGCLNGACLQSTNQTNQTNATCIDSDGGKNYYLKGTINATGWGADSDSCLGPNTLIEFYCENNQRKVDESVNCPNGCSNGACLNQTNQTCYTSGTNCCKGMDVCVNSVTALMCQLGYAPLFQGCSADCMPIWECAIQDQIQLTCNSGKRYEITSANRLYDSRRRQPTSFIFPNGTLKIGIKDIDTGKIYYNYTYTLGTNKPELIKIAGNTAIDNIKKYDDYTIDIDISIPELAECRNVKQPMKLLVGDAFLGENVAYIYPKNIIPKNVLDPTKPWATISVGQMMQEYDLLRITDIVYDLQTQLFGKKPINGDALFLSIMPPWCGGAGPTIGFGVGCLINPSNEPHWGVILHEIGHVFTGHFQLDFQDGMGGNYPGNRNIFMSNLDRHYDIAFSEATATLGAMYAEYHLIKDHSLYGIEGGTYESLNRQFQNNFNYLNDLKKYENEGSNFGKMDANILDGIFLTIMNDTNLNPYGWELYPKAFSIYLDPLPVFITGPLTNVQSHTYFIAGMNAASGRDMRQKFRGWNFPIDDAYYNQIYPILLAKIGQINCTNECVSGQKRCSGNQAQSCGNYDPDPCTEWKLVSNCPYGCANGACVQATYCYDNENNPNCICPDESVKEAFAICGTCPEGSVACSGFCQTKYRCVETPIYVYFTTDKPFYGLNEPVRVDVFGNIDSETVNVNIINPNGISGQLTLYKTEDSVKEFSVTSSYNHYTGNYTNTAITGKYFIDFVSLQGHLYKFNRGQFYVFDREQIERYLILKDIRDFIYQKYDINFYSQELTGYFAVYTRGDKQYLVYVYDFGDQEKIIKFLQQSVGYIKRHTITIDDYYIYEIDFDGRTAYLWSYNNILIIALESPTYTAIAEASSTSQFTATGMIATSDYCGTDSMNAQCVCYEKELKEEFMPPCATDVCTQVMHHRCVSYYPKSLLVAYMEKFPSDVLSKNTECSDNGGYCVPTTATCRQEYETSIYGCGFAESKCCVKKVTPEQLIEIVLKLEELKIKISELKAKADAISIYYFNTSDNANGNRFKQISEMLDDVRNKIDDVIKLIKDNKDNFDAVRDDIKNGIEDIKESIKDIADTLLSATCTQDSDCAVDKKCLNNICVDKCAGVPCPEYSKQCSDGTTARCTPSCVSGECGTCTATCPEGTQLTPTTTGTPVLAAQSASSNFAECLDQCNKNYGITSCWDYCTGGSVQSTTTTGSTSGGMVPSATIGGDKGYCYNANEGIEECDNCDCDSDSRDDPVNCIGVCDGITGCCRWSTEGGDGDGGGGYWGSGGGSDYCSDWLTYDPWYCSWYEMFAMA